MPHGYITVRQSIGLSGNVNLVGAKNATLPIIASLIMTNGTSVLTNVPYSSDVIKMVYLMRHLGAKVFFDQNKKELTIDTSTINNYNVSTEIMSAMRASILVMGPLLARFGKAHVALPGGCLIGPRPINYHIEAFKLLGVVSRTHGKMLEADFFSDQLISSYRRIVFEYPSVGATENVMMLACVLPGITTIINAALEPEVLDLIDVLRKMGATIVVNAGAVIEIEGGATLHPINHEVIPDRLEAGALLVAASITQGSISLPNARVDHLDSFIQKLREMGHEVTTGAIESVGMIPRGITLKACMEPQAIKLKTGPYPSFPTDLQPPLMAALSLAQGTSIVEETVFENRLMQVQELQKMGAQITVNGTTATIRGVNELYGTDVLAHDIRGACALVLAGLRAEGMTTVTGLQHWRRAYDHFELKLQSLGALINSVELSDQEDLLFNEQKSLITQILP